MEKKTYRIGEVAEILNLKPSVLRYWESEFYQIDPLRTDKGQRLYTEEHVALLTRIRQLLHEQGMTIEGTRRVLEGSAIVDETAPGQIVPVPDPVFMQMLITELLSIRQMLLNVDNQ